MPERPASGSTTHRSYEDFAVGDEFDFDEVTVSREDIVRFAREFDPLPFHLDEEAAARSIFGGLVASGPHTLCLGVRMIHEGLMARSSMVGSPGLTDLRWKRPVRPGDRLRGHLAVASATPHRDGLGLIQVVVRLRNQRDEEVLSARVDYLLRLRCAA